MLKSYLCDSSDASIVVKGDVTVERNNNGHRKNRSLAFKHNVPLISCITLVAL